MTHEQARDLGWRLIAACGIGPEVLLAVDSARSRGLTEYRGAATGVLWRLDEVSVTWFPDLRDAATRGAALELVRERLGAPLAVALSADLNGLTWAVWRSAGHHYQWGNEHADEEYRPLVPHVNGAPVWARSEEEALVVAVEVAP